MTKKIEDGGLAFSGKRMEEIGFVNIGGDIEKTFAEAEHPGMSLRDWFAGQALVGLMAHSFDDGSDFLHDAGPAAAAYQAYRMADAMIAASESNGVSE